MSQALAHQASFLDFAGNESIDRFMLEPALSVVIEALEKIRRSSEEPLRLSRSTLDRFVSLYVGSREPPDKAVLLDQIRTRVCGCTKCPHLARSRTQTVFGVGNPDAELMFIGEAPGAEEDAEGEPFVGRAGQLLTRIIQTMGLRRQDVYIANILKCRPDMPPGSFGNRPPTAEEMQTCIGYLLEQIAIIQPRVMVALGSTAVQGLLGIRAAMHQLRGRWQTFGETPLMVTYHPSYLLRNQSPGEKRKVWEDMLAVLERLEHPISERQRRYFL
jgi:uracil-DNA glycosylase family 4